MFEGWIETGAPRCDVNLSGIETTTSSGAGKDDTGRGQIPPKRARLGLTCPTPQQVSQETTKTRKFLSNLGGLPSVICAQGRRAYRLNLSVF